MLSTIMNIVLPAELSMARIGIMFLWAAVSIFMSLCVDGREYEFPCIARICKISNVLLIVVGIFMIAYYNLWC